MILMENFDELRDHLGELAELFWDGGCVGVEVRGMG